MIGHLYITGIHVNIIDECAGNGDVCDWCETMDIIRYEIEYMLYIGFLYQDTHVTLFPFTQKITHSLVLSINYRNIDGCEKQVYS